jgi:IQ calmodulin-binding motif
MDKISKLLSNHLVNNLNYSQNYHKSNFTKSIKAQYQDNSLEKNRIAFKIHQAHLANLNKAREILNQKKNYRKDLVNRIDLYEKNLKDYDEKVKTTYETEELMERSAVKIQKVARGYLLRKSVEQEWIRMKKNKLFESVKDFERSQYRNIFKLGKLPNIAAVVIQGAFKRNIFYKKIIRITRTFMILSRKKEEETYRKIKSMLLQLYSKQILKKYKFDKFRTKRLGIIKRKLALLAIKNVFKREKISWKIVKIRLRKFKRMNTLNKKKIQRRSTTINEKSLEESKVLEKNKKNDKKVEIIKNNEESDTKNIQFTKNDNEINTIKVEVIENTEEIKDSSQDSKEMSSSSSQESIETTTTEKEAIARAELLKKLEEERQEKIALGKISYNIREKDDNKLLPYLKGVSGSNPDVIPFKPFIEKPPIYPKNYENKAYSPLKNKKRIITGDYMKETAAYQFRYNNMPEPDEETPKKPHKTRKNSTLMAPTTAFTQKILGKPSARSHSTETKPTEKLEIPKINFSSVSNIEPPSNTTKPKQMPILWVKPQKVEPKEEKIQPNTTRFSLSFYDALPEFSGFLAAYAQTPKKHRLEPIVLKGSKKSKPEIVEL